MINAQIKRKRMVAETVLKVQPMTAKEMALTPHTLSRDGSMARMNDGSKWVWDNRFEHWACWSK